MTIASAPFAPIRLAAAAIEAGGGRLAYAIANGVDAAQARREAVASIGRAVSYEASVMGLADLLVLLGLALVLALALALGLERDPYGAAARPAFAVRAPLSPPNPR